MMNSQQQQEQQFQQNKQIGSGLTRYRTAPSSYFSSFLNAPSDGGLGADNLEGLISPRALSPETQRIFSRFMNSGDSIQENSYTEPQFLPPVKVEPEVQQRQQRQQRQQSSEYSSEAANSGAVVNIDSRIFGTFDSNRESPTKMQRVGGANSGLIRHSSSPAGLFADIDIENEFGTTRAVGTMNAETSFCSTSRIKSRMDFSSRRTCSSSGMMDPITEIESKDMGENGAVGGDNVDYITGFSLSSWDDSAGLSDDFLKGLTDDDTKRFSTANANDDQRNVGANRPSTALLSHHLSLPQAAMEKLLQDSVPCKIRAKRGCATHPRSIAERVRRTKISERMRKLQELVPNMEKQTNTSDMLDLAVDYIKDLQRQLKSLSDNREKCSCSAKQRS